MNYELGVIAAVIAMVCWGSTFHEKSCLGTKRLGL